MMWYKKKRVEMDQKNWERGSRPKEKSMKRVVVTGRKKTSAMRLPAKEKETTPWGVSQKKGKEGS